MDVRLPNGQVVKNVPEGISQEELMQMVIKSGAATKQDFGIKDPLEQVKETLTPMLPEVGGLAGALAGAKLGFGAGAVAGPGGMLIGSAIGAFAGAGAGESLRQLVEGENPDVLRAIGEASVEGGIDVVGGKAFDIIKGAKDLALNAIGYGARDISSTQILRDLQAKLQREYGSTLRGSQIDPNARIVAGMESAAEQAIGSRNALGQIAEAQNRYLDDQVEALISVSDKLEGEQLGLLLKNLVENTRGASSEAFSQAFKELSAQGKGVKVSLQGPRNRAQLWRKSKMQGLTKRMQEKIRRNGARIPFTSAQIQKSVDDLLTLSPNTTFDKAFDKLKDLKGRLSAMRGDPATANDPAVAELTAIVKGFEESLLKSASKTSPELAATYKGLMESYENSQKVLFSDVAVRILREGSPELVGRSLTQQGTVTPIKEVRKILDEAKKLGVKSGGDVLKGLRQGFLAKHLSSAEGQAMATLTSLKKKLADPDFARTFNEVVPPEQKKRVYRLLEEAEILNRGVGGEFSLAVRSSQLAGAQGVASGGGNAGLIANIAKVITPAKLADAVADPQRAQRMLRMIKTANRYVNVPESMPPEVARALSLMLAKFSGTAAFEYQQQQTKQEMAPVVEELKRMRATM